MERKGWKSTAWYVGLLAAAFAVAVAGSAKFGAELDNYAYDYMFRLYQPKPWTPQSAILAIDEVTLAAVRGGMRGIRTPLAEGVRLVAAARPKAVVIDVTLHDEGDPAEDAALAGAFCATPNLVLASLVMGNPLRWDDPNPRFLRCAAAVGHVHAQPDENDSVTRSIPLLEFAGRDRRWALALEAFRLSRGAPIEEFYPQTSLRVGSTLIPARPGDQFRVMRVRYVPPGMRIPSVSLKDLLETPALAGRFTGKVVFVGVTALEMGDRLFTPYASGRSTSGIEIHANAFETMAQGLFLTDVWDPWVWLFSLGLVVAAGLSFRYLPGWWAYAGGLLVLAAAQAAPYIFFTRLRVFSFATPASAAWFGTLTAAAYYTLVVRRNWHIEQSARERYQQAMHFVTHEMRTPLSSIQGSSELISRYPLTEEKRKQIAQLINSESKRLAKMVEIFLSVERLSAGQMELKREAIAVKPTVEGCVDRIRLLAERKRIAIRLEPIPEELTLTGDRELMEYACYNLLTNAVKYSPRDTEVTVSAGKAEGRIRIAVKDQGIGMDQKEVKHIFQKFYRTKKAEESGEAGTGIGLSIVQQIVEQHGGQIEVASQPGAGSCFTLVMPAAAGRPLGPPVPSAVQRH